MEVALEFWGEAAVTLGEEDCCYRREELRSRFATWGSGALVVRFGKGSGLISKGRREERWLLDWKVVSVKGKWR